MVKSKKFKKKVRAKLLQILMIAICMFVIILIVHDLKPLQYIRSTDATCRQTLPDKPIQVQFEFYKAIANREVKVLVAEKLQKETKSKSLISRHEELKKDLLKHIKGHLKTNQ